MRADEFTLTNKPLTDGRNRNVEENVRWWEPGVDPSVGHTQKAKPAAQFSEVHANPVSSAWVCFFDTHFGYDFTNTRMRWH